MTGVQSAGGGSWKTAYKVPLVLRQKEATPSVKVGYDQVNTSLGTENVVEMSSIAGFGANGCESTPGLVEKNPEAVDSCPMGLRVNNAAELQLSVSARLSFMYHLEPDPCVRATSPICIASRNPVDVTRDLVLISVCRKGKRVVAVSGSP